MKPGETIRSRRGALGLTQEQLADALDVTAAAVSKWGKQPFPKRKRQNTHAYTLPWFRLFHESLNRKREKRQS